MEISGIDKLDIGTSNIIIEGKVTYTKTPRHVEGDNEKGHYDFWSQFVVIEDATGKMGCNTSIEKEEYELKNGIVARVKGKLREYEDKNGEMQKVLDCKLTSISGKDKITDVQQEVAEEYFEKKAKEEKADLPVESPKDTPKKNVWEEKDLRIARECAVKAVTELVCAKIMGSKDFFTFANTIVKYIYHGLADNPKPTKADRIETARKVVRKGLKIKDKDASFPGEPTKEELETIENKVNKKEKADEEEYLASEDMPE